MVFIRSIALVFLVFSYASVFSQDITVYTSYEDLEREVLTIQDDKVYVINFWATWCGPCVKELPYFEDLRNEYIASTLAKSFTDGREVEFILVSIDWETNLERKVKPFVAKQGLESRVILFDDPKANDWIDKIDPSWSGAIPITLFKDKNGQAFYEKEYHTTEELKADLLTFINHN